MVVDVLRSCYSSTWHLPGVGDVAGYFYWADDDAEIAPEGFLGSAQWHRGDGTPWPPYGELEGATRAWWDGSITTECPMKVGATDLVPLYEQVTTLLFDQADGFVLDSPDAHEVTVDLADASSTQRGIVSLTNQVLGTGRKLLANWMFAGDFIANNLYDFGHVAGFSSAFGIGLPNGGYGVALTNGNWTPGAAGLAVHTIQPAANHLQIQSWLTPGGVPTLQASLLIGPDGLTASAVHALAYFASGGAQGATGTFAGQTVVDGLITGGAATITVADISDYTAATDALISAAIAAHLAAGDPHPQYLTQADGDALYQPIGAVSYTDEDAQDAVGSILTDSAEVDFTYNDGVPSITATLKTTGVGAGEYTKVTVDTKGRVTSATTLLNTDIPDLDGFTPAVIADADQVPFSDVSAVANRKTTALALQHYILPSGLIMQFGGAAVPSGWLDCDGSAVSRTTYADLFAAIATTWGAGNGSTTFNVPDLRGRGLIGVGTGSGLSTRNLAGSGGTETHTLSTAEMPSHNHNPIYQGSGGGSANIISQIAVGAPPYNVTALSSPMTDVGGGGAHNNMMPFANVKHIIKT